MINALMQNPISVVGIAVIGAAVVVMAKGAGKKSKDTSLRKDMQQSQVQLPNPFEVKKPKTSAAGAGILDIALLLMLICVVSVGSDKLPEGNIVRRTIDGIYNAMPDDPSDNISGFLFDSFQ